MNEILRRFLWLPPQSSTAAYEIDWLHYFVILVTIFGTLLVPIVGAYFLIKYRRPGQGLERPTAPSIASDPPAAGTPPTRPSQPVGKVPFFVEMVVIVVLLSFFVLWWFIGYRQYIWLRVPPEDAMEVYVMGKQWMWKFSYPDGSASVGNLYVPAGRPIKLIMNSRDVIHSFFVPDFRIKQDVLPGRYTTVWFEVKEPGVHDIFCTEYCGTGHSMMRGQVIALSPEDYERWLDGNKDLGIAGQRYEEPAVVGDFSPEEELELAKMGEIAAARYGCLRCHSVDGAPHIGPTWARLYGSKITLANGETLRVDEAYLTESMMDPQAKIRHGFKAVMPTYQGIIRMGETAAIVEYIKSLRDYEDAPRVPPMEEYVPTTQAATTQATTQPATQEATTTQATSGPASAPTTQPATDTALPTAPTQPGAP